VPRPSTSSAAPTTPEPSPAPTPTGAPTPTETPGPGALDPDSIAEAVISRDAAGLVAQLGDPIHVIDTLNATDAVKPAAEAQANLIAVIDVGENFKPGQAGDYELLAASAHPEFGAPDAVVLVGSLGSTLSFLPGAFLRLTP